MRRFYFVTALVAVAVCSVQAFDVVVRHAGTATTYTSTDITSVKFAPSGDVNVMMKDGSTVAFTSEEFESIDFDAHSSVVDNLKSIGLQISGSEIVSDQPVEVYSVKGEIVGRAASGRFNLQGLSAGVYVIKSGSSTTKIVVK